MINSQSKLPLDYERWLSAIGHRLFAHRACPG
jgi:hypothetical protein